MKDRHRLEQGSKREKIGMGSVQMNTREAGSEWRREGWSL